MALYFCHLSHNGSRIDDARGFDADDHDEASEIARAIGTILLDKNPHAGDVVVELYADSGELIFTSSLIALLGDLQ